MDAFERKIEDIKATIQAVTQQSDFLAWQYSVTCCNTGETVFGKV